MNLCNYCVNKTDDRSCDVWGELSDDCDEGAIDISKIKELEKQNEKYKKILPKCAYLLGEFSHHFLDSSSAYEKQVDDLHDEIEEILKEV